MAKKNVSKAKGGPEVGRTGLRQQNGVVLEEWQRDLMGPKGVRVYTEMLADAIIGAIQHAIAQEIRSVTWEVEAADESSKASEIAEFIESCMDDMSHSWEDFIAEVLTMLPYGWAYFETVYKVRNGYKPGSPGESSESDDGRIGWRKLPIRSQDSLYRWELQDDGGVAGMWQSPPTMGSSNINDVLLIPIEKGLLFRPTAHKGNPEGVSTLRTAYQSYYLKKRIESFEVIGVERDLGGLPKIGLPAEWLGPSATPDQKNAVLEYERMGEQVRNDEKGVVILPRKFDAQNNEMFTFELMSSGAKGIATGPIVERHARYMAMTVLADVILIGHESVGSFSLAQTKKNMLSKGLEGWTRSIASVLNRHAIPRLMELNNLPMELAPTIEPSPVQEIDLTEFGAWITALSGAGYPLFPNEELEAFLARISGMPYTPMAERPEEEQEAAAAKPPVPPESDEVASPAPPSTNGGSPNGKAPKPTPGSPEGKPTADSTQRAGVGKVDDAVPFRIRGSATPF
jgi:hypothetical protein